jgi:hypothetical protein
VRDWVEELLDFMPGDDFYYAGVKAAIEERARIEWEEKRTLADEEMVNLIVKNIELRMFWRASIGQM